MDESVQTGGSFKGRALGALRLEQALIARRRSGFATFTSGNQGIIACLLAKQLGVRCAVVVPSWIESEKLSVLRDLGAEVHFGGEDALGCESFALKLAEDRQLSMIHPFRSCTQLVGYMTLWREIATAFPGGVDVVVPVGSGALFASAVEFRRRSNARYRVIGVEPLKCASLAASLRAGTPLMVEGRSSAAPALNVNFVPDEWFHLVSDLQEDELVVVDDFQIENAVALLSAGGSLVDPAAAAGVAHVLFGSCRFHFPQTIVIITGRGGTFSRTRLEKDMDDNYIQRHIGSFAPVRIGDLGTTRPNFGGLTGLLRQSAHREFG